jgi:hypothetical protein
MCALFLLGNAQAVSVGFNGANGSDLLTNSASATAMSVGTIINNIGGQFGGQDVRDAYMVNNLRTLALGAYSSGFPDGQEYHRTATNFGVLPAATIVGAVNASGGGLSASGGIVSLTLGTTFQYLVVAYDGPNGGVIVYNISSLAAGTVIELAQFARPSGADGAQILIQDTGQYGMTGWTLLNPGQTTVPEGGATVMLLGASLGALAIGRRVLRKRSPAV